MSIGGVIVSFRADADKAIKTIDKVTRSLGRVEDGSVKANAKFSKMAKVGLGAVAAGAGVAAFAMFDFAKAAAADWQEARKLERALSRIPGVTDAMVESNAAWIDSMEIATTVADSDLRNAIATLAVATGDLTQAQTLAALAVDVAVGRNLSLESVTRMLEKAVGGNTNALKRQMPWLDENKDGVITLEEAVSGLTDTYGGAAEALADNSPWERIKAIWSQVKESFGQFIIAPLEEFAAWAADPANLAKVQGWITQIGDWSYEIGVTFKSKVEEFLDYIRSDEGQQTMEDFTVALQATADAFKAVGAAVAGLKKVVDFVQKPLQWLWDRLESIARFFDETVPKWGRALGLNNKPTPSERSKFFDNGEGRPLSSNERRSGGNTFNVTVNNGRQEPAIDSAALALRMSRELGRRAVA